MPARPIPLQEMKRATIILALVLAATGLIAGSAIGADAEPTAGARSQALDRDILKLLNATRVARGLRPLALSLDLRRAAAVHSRSMIDGGFFKHESRDGSPFNARVKRFYRLAGYDTWSVGENLLYSAAETNASAAIEAWLDSPAHRDNMLNPAWREVGIGSLFASSAGGTFRGEPTLVITMDLGVRSRSKPRKLAATRKVIPAFPAKA